MKYEQPSGSSAQAAAKLAKARRCFDRAAGRAAGQALAAVVHELIVMGGRAPPPVEAAVAVVDSRRPPRPAVDLSRMVRYRTFLWFFNQMSKP